MLNDFDKDITSLEKKYKKNLVLLIIFTIPIVLAITYFGYLLVKDMIHGTCGLGFGNCKKSYGIQALEADILAFIVIAFVYILYFFGGIFQILSGNLSDFDFKFYSNFLIILIPAAYFWIYSYLIIITKKTKTDLKNKKNNE